LAESANLATLREGPLPTHFAALHGIRRAAAAGKPLTAKVTVAARAAVAAAVIMSRVPGH